MKKLEDLGISPAPWKSCRDGEVVHGEGYSLTDGDGYFVLKPDARLIAAAPELYESLFDMVEMYRDGGSYEYEQEVLRRAKAALAEAAGESEVAND